MSRITIQAILAQNSLAEKMVYLITRSSEHDWFKIKKNRIKENPNGKGWVKDQESEHNFYLLICFYCFLAVCSVSVHVLLCTDSHLT